MSIFINPDVDRISLAQRVKSLEDNCGSGSTGPGINTGSTVITNAIDFDQYPDNAFSISDKGIIFKMSIDRNTPGSGFLPGGMDFKMCMLVPTLYQFVVPGNITPTIIVRLKLENDLATSIDSTLNKSFIDYQAFTDYCNGNTNFDLLQTLFGIAYFPKIVGYRDLLGKSSPSVVDNSSYDDWLFQIAYSIHHQRFTFSTHGFTRKNAGVYYGVFQRGSHHLASSERYPFYGYTVIGGNIGYSLLLDKPSDMPNWFRQFYPNSWCV